MSKTTYILMVFEGKKTEPIIVENIKKYFVNESDKIIVKAIYGTVIYKLYEQFFICGEFDEDLESFALLKEMISDDGLAKLNREQISEIYLFFDYDGHSPNSSDEKLQKMFEIFDNETKNGKLYISYPMVEAIKHLKEGVDFKDILAECSSNYKNIVSDNCDSCLIHLKNLSKDNWDYIIDEHSKKANFIINDEFSFPKELIEQNQIFNTQKIKYLKTENKVSVLASFPLFLLDYYGIDKFKK
ncbi:hypothetical protein [Aliarcobacter butzleri]|uniref:hypothetical protein n=1 Tax=Aliarcobacter butzleri TaxID=28197 RepID=UPI001ED9D55D|nr:hypothetical protein [Aliarcobacter butzleri]MCG3671552.1 hypothetical protein [Aliarcobacter butzleri]MCG3690528.1 hypothetical protein [Aliarcobacter butzleri]